jgi:hypothetical protein
MAERSGSIAFALFLMPTLCVVAIRYGLSTVNEVVSNDIIVEITIHSIALIIGIIMYLRYGVVEDHEYHRSAAIKRLGRSYSQEDKGLWDNSDPAMSKLEEKADTAVKGRKGAMFQAKMSGNIGSLNVESPEVEVDDNMDVEVVTHHRGINTIVDESVLEIGKNPKKSFLSNRLEKSAIRRLEKKKIKAQRKELKKNKTSSKTKSSSDSNNSDNQWNLPISSNLTKSVVACKECGTLNNSTNPYCTSCGTYLS